MNQPQNPYGAAPPPDPQGPQGPRPPPRKPEDSTLIAVLKVIGWIVLAFVVLVVIGVGLILGTCFLGAR
jgi:hypothetical protein